VRRILTIDGGGIKGVFPAAFLVGLEDAIGAPVADYFDLIAGTSTGGIIALALGLGISARDILRLYVENADRVFPQGLRFGLPGIFRAKYAKSALREVLTEAFGDRLLGASRKRLLIPSLNLASEHVHLYKTSHHPSLVNDYRVSAVEAAMATVAAPTYFPIHLSPEGVPFIDGSVWANNPLGLAVIEAVGVLNWPPSDIWALSLGCTSAPLKLSWRKRTSLGVSSYWGDRLAQVFMTAQSSSAVVTANVLIGADHVFRINPEISRHHFTLDGLRHLPALSQLGFAEAATWLPTLAPVFFTEPAAPFEPDHKLPGPPPAVAA
jgi:hypothetical protein